MKKVLDLSLEFESNDDRDLILFSIDKELLKQKKTLVRVSTHDCYHDEGKSCKNKVVIRDDISDTPDACPTR